MDHPLFFTTSIYTMRRSSELEYLYAGERTGTFIERKVWRTGLDHFHQARDANQVMPIFFSAAEEDSGLIYYATLSNIDIDEAQETTTYSFENLQQIHPARPKSVLQLQSANKNLSDDFIRPYAVCKTPADLSEWVHRGCLPLIPKSRKMGNEPFLCNGQMLDFNLIDFWRWSASDIIDNTTRGNLAEFIVASALNLADKVQVGWKAFDLLTADGIKVEVKSSAYIQSWQQKTYSDIIFSIRKARAWDDQTNVMESESRRQSDVYVFCLLKHKVQENLNPLDIDQWVFYVLPTHVLNEKMNDKKQLTLKQLENLSPIKCGYSGISKAVYKQRH